MINKEERTIPYCRFKREQLIASSGDDEADFEADPTPVERLSEEIHRRTNQVAGTSKDSVSPIPIILRVEYCQCANLTLIDTPGFRIGGDPQLQKNIQTMVRQLIEPDNRIIVCLEQSTVEWANTISRPLVREVDPSFQRTILVNSKFDNRVKELQTQEQANSYFSCDGMYANTTMQTGPFFISLPLRRNLEPRRFAESIKDCIAEDYSRLLEVNWDEAKFGNQLGFHRVKSYLESLLQARYQAELTPTLDLLEEVCKKASHDLETVRSELAEKDPAAIKSVAKEFILALNESVKSLLQGSVLGSPEIWGQTLAEEKQATVTQEWPNFPFRFNIQNQALKIYGGAQYQRLLNEFEHVVHSREFPNTRFVKDLLLSIHELASALGISPTHNAPLYESAASNIVQIKAKQVLEPLIDILLERTSYVMKRLFHIGCGIIQELEPRFCVLFMYKNFLEFIQQEFENFITTTARNCRPKIREDFHTFLTVVNWDLVSGLKHVCEYTGDYMNVSPEKTTERVNRVMGEDSDAVSFDGIRSRTLTDDVHKKICNMAGALFSGIRFFFAKYSRSKMDCFFLNPMFSELGPYLLSRFLELNESELDTLFASGRQELIAFQQKLEQQVVRVQRNRDKFKQAYQSIGASTKVIQQGLLKSNDE